MRFIHTSDWHLGRSLETLSLFDDQARALEDILALAKDEKVDAFFVAGDIYDRGVPPPEAVELLNSFVTRLVRDLKIPLVMIAGNHDSRQRLGFASSVLGLGGLHLFGPAEKTVRYVDLSDKHGSVRVYALPYAEPAEWREVLGDASMRDHQAGFARYLTETAAAHPKGLRSAILAHCFARGGAVSDSERSLSVGGGGEVDAGLFDAFGYAALGHLHHPQKAGKAWYSGSLLQYSKSEAGDAKSVCLVDMDASGACSVKRVPLTPRRSVRVVKGAFDELLRSPRGEDYVFVELTDRGQVIDAGPRLRAVFPNLAGVEREHQEVRPLSRPASADLARMSDAELFARFFESESGQKPSAEHLAVFEQAVESVRKAEEAAQ